MRSTRILMALALLAFAGPARADDGRAAAAGCSAGSFTVTKVRVAVDGDWAKLTAILRHSCPIAIGVQLKWSAFYADGTVAFAEDFWPASTLNIQPNTDYPFEMLNQAPRGKWTYKVDALSVTAW